MSIDRSDVVSLGESGLATWMYPLKIFFGEHIPALIPFHIHLQSY